MVRWSVEISLKGSSRNRVDGRSEDRGCFAKKGSENGLSYLTNRRRRKTIL